MNINNLHHNAKNISGRIFGKLIAIKPIKKRKNAFLVWQCRCDCGKICFVRSSDLLSGHTRSCGCLPHGQHLIKHNMSKTLTYTSWESMHARCNNSNREDYQLYGARGISVCKRWNKFENFYEDMGERPEDKTIDRWPNKNGNYEPGNCRWATPKEQANNRRPKSCGPCKQSWFRAWHKDSMCQYLSNNQHEFARKHDLDQGCISACILNKQKIHRKWQFERVQI